LPLSRIAEYFAKSGIAASQALRDRIDSLAHLHYTASEVGGDFEMSNSKAVANQEFLQPSINDARPEKHDLSVSECFREVKRFSAKLEKRG
ncbi:MAG: hypothetical protein KY475_11360, partial [Planctomycetes bacterium]|nr:hypothetical protein [Planctomycetota bacterium]